MARVYFHHVIFANVYGAHEVRMDNTSKTFLCYSA